MVAFRHLGRRSELKVYPTASPKVVLPELPVTSSSLHSRCGSIIIGLNAINASHITEMQRPRRG
ncbi:hypothetical protein LX32DRAFT_636202 [Colletotrichum zoysiae]|uniref:Uncharacterized protein n=1 Tax=Colletotrichum zoysiae TaxID=1216348 RepID=A0AAD9HQN7_9PEZI|nr:hypothetical protein LX32DRAFT_636202 [Colletotrichum zoysiae]